MEEIYYFIYLIVLLLIVYAFRHILIAILMIGIGLFLLFYLPAILGNPDMIIEPILSNSKIIDASDHDKAIIEKVLDNSPWFVKLEITKIKIVSLNELQEICNYRSPYIVGCASIQEDSIFTNMRFPASIYLISSNQYTENRVYNFEYSTYHEVGHVILGNSETEANNYASKCIISDCTNYIGISKIDTYFHKKLQAEAQFDRITGFTG